MGGRGGSGSRNSSESVEEFLNRAVGDNDIVRIEGNDMLPIKGTKSEVLKDSRFKKTYSNMYFGTFKVVGREIHIQATGNSDTAERLKRRTE